jgi:hypothetical protein
MPEKVLGIDTVLIKKPITWPEVTVIVLANKPEKVA